VCPANWNPGQESIKETTAGKKAYLEQKYGNGDGNGNGEVNDSGYEVDKGASTTVTNGQ
jgi:hypothetical protein